MPRLKPSNPLYPPSGVRAGQWSPNGLMLRDARGIPTIERARTINRTLGTASAEKFLRSRGWSVEAAAYFLARRGG